MLNELAAGTWFEFKSNKQNSFPCILTRDELLDTYFWHDQTRYGHQQQQLLPFYAH